MLNGQPTGLNILLIEANDKDAKILQEHLSANILERKYAIDRATSISEAIAKLKSKIYQVVLLDIALNDNDGLININIIKMQNAGMPIVILGSSHDIQLAIKSIRCGAQEYISKNSTDSIKLDLAILSSIERKVYEISLLNLAYVDELTGIANRRMFLEYMERILARAKRRNMQEAVLFMDVNGFKKINDQFGHEIGDLLLKKIADTLKSLIRTADMLARIGGDEFVIHIDCQSGIIQQKCEKIANKIIAAFSEPLIIDKYKIRKSISIGIAYFPHNGQDVDAILHSADKAMYYAKKNKQKYSFA